MKFRLNAAIALAILLLAPENGGGSGGEGGNGGAGAGGEGAGAGAGGDAGKGDAGAGGAKNDAGKGDGGDKGGGDKGAGDKGADKGGDGGDKDTGADWLKSVPAAHLKTAQKYKSPDEFWAAHGELQSKLGKMVQPPGKDAKPEEVAAFYERLGRPKAADGYKIPAITGKDGKPIVISEARFKAIAPGFHEAGLSQAQVDKLVAKEIAISQQIGEQQQQAHAQAHAKLVQGWNGNDVANYELARRVAFDVLDKDDRKEFGIEGDDPKAWPASLVRWLYKVSPSFQDSKFIGRGERDVGKTDEALQAEAKELQGKSDYWQNEAHQKRVAEIFGALHGKAAA